jgi:hypothetical protein
MTSGRGRSALETRSHLLETLIVRKMGWSCWSRRPRLEGRCSGQRNCFDRRCIGDCARTVHESNVFIALGLASSEKQIPQIVENIGNQNSGRS